MTDFSAKNSARRSAAAKDDSTPGQRREARANRRLVRGAFGFEPASFQELCLPGTHGRVSPNAKKSKKAKEVTSEL